MAIQMSLAQRQMTTSSSILLPHIEHITEQALGAGLVLDKTGI